MVVTRPLRGPELRLFATLETARQSLRQDPEVLILLRPENALEALKSVSRCSLSAPQRQLQSQQAARATSLEPRGVLLAIRRQIWNQ
jgi:hypothetical protein